ncbi:hypothetical protein, partial [Nonomuraea antimicrobica]|uniref:hypothetical protein n=1 Tax=Nonomuraea antimicrobica TaxID=561173 RepID=UPI0031EA9E2D
MSPPARVLAVVSAVLLLLACAPVPPATTGVSAASAYGARFGLKWNAYELPSRFRAAVAGYSGGPSFHDIVWCAVERRPGSRTWSLEDKVVDDILGRGYELLIRVRIGSCWASGRPATDRVRISPSYPPTDLGRYQAFVRELVGRYARRGVHLYAVENEIDAATSWGADPAAYRQVGQAGARAVRQADPKARLVDPGLSSSSYGLAIARRRADAGDTEAALTFYREFYRRRTGRRFPA